MSKYLSLMLAASFITTTSVASPLINNHIVAKAINNLTTNRPFYQNINSAFSNYSADVHQQCAYANDSYTGSTGTIFNWSQYANSWDEFKSNYNGLTLQVNMNVAFDWYNITWASDSFYVPLSNIQVDNSNWISIHEETQTTTQGSRWDGCHARLDYKCWVSGNSILIAFKLTTWATNNYDNFYFNIDTRKIICNSTYNYNTIYGLLNKGVNNQTLNTLQSDYSTSLQDTRNWPLINKNIQQLVESSLGTSYDAWKNIIFPKNTTSNFTYNDTTRIVTLTIIFNDPNTNRQVKWDLNINVILTLSGNYWEKTLQQRLHITPGQVINPNDPYGSMMVDTPLQWASKTVYGTSSNITFAGAPDDSETMKVNSQPIQAIDHQFTFDMTDHQNHTDDKGKPTNEYDILLEKHDLKDWNHILGHYEIDYVIKQNVPSLQLKWYAWAPDKNPDQNDLITPTLPNGKPNPKYDSEVNPKTGTKTQIIWVKHLAEKPFPLDPLNDEGKRWVTNPDLGFFAEGSVSGMGIQQTFSDSWIKSVTREKVNAQDLSSVSQPININSDDQGQYFSSSGTYHYTLTDQKGFTSNKFITIGQDYQNKYAKFLDVLNNPNIAVDFWTTIHGLHLKYYLMQNKSLDSKAILNLNFEQVESYWKEYVSDVQTQHVPINPDPSKITNLSTLNLENIKINDEDIKTIKNNILNGFTTNGIKIKGVIEQLKPYGLENDIDYKINDLDDNNLHKLLNFNNKGNATIEITINALPTSTKASGSTHLTIINLKDSLENAVDLSQIKFNDLQYNYNSFKSEQLKEWILDEVKKGVAKYPYIDKDQHKSLLVYQTDYDVKPLDTATLVKFLNSKTKTKLTIIISADNLPTNKAVNSTTLILINDPNAPPAPPDPPDPKPPVPPTPPNPPNPVPNPGWFSQGKNLAWFLPIATIGSIGFIIFIYWYKIRKNKKIK